MVDAWRDFRRGVTDDGPHRLARGDGQGLHTADDLAVEALLVEVALAGDHHVGGDDGIVQVELICDQFEPR